MLNTHRGAGPITISRPDKSGKLVIVKTLPAPTIETTRDPVAKRGPKPGHKGKAAEKEARFAASGNWY